MRAHLNLLICIAVISMSAFAQSAQTPVRKPIAAPTYYVTVQARTCEPDVVQFNGASNLPTGAMIGISIVDFYHDAWKDYSDEVFLPVDERGFFEGRIEPKKGIVFHRNLILLAEFTTFRPKQQTSVLKVVGRKGQQLGDLLTNPQMYQVSGPYYLLETIARVPWCGEGLPKRSDNKKE